MSENNRDGETSLADIYKILVRYKKLIVGLPVLGAVVASLFSFAILHPTWEASAVLEVGKIGQAAQTPPLLVEPPSTVVTRILSPSFVRGVIKRAGAKADELYALKEFYKTIKATQIKGSELIEIKLRGPSAEKAEDIILSVIGSLQQTHAEMMTSSVEKNKKELQQLVENIASASLEVELLKKKLLAAHNWNTFDATLAATLLNNKTVDLRNLVQRKLNLEEQLAPSRTYTTRVIGEVYISEGAVSPNKILIISIAVLLGLFGAIVFALVHNAIVSTTKQ
ncbi:Wzz/FepE/Etk N-terminal domain-containing protein [Sideroxydans sp.]